MNEKYLIISDIHGSPSFLEKALNIYVKEKYNKLFILGDLFYSGARNIPPVDYQPKKIVELLNSRYQDIIVVKGNCESDVDLMVSKFPIFEIYSTILFDKKVAFYHGHQNYKKELSRYNDIIFTGHTHISMIQKEGSVIYVNPGSISLPKDEHHSYISFEKGKITIFDLESLKEINKIIF